MFFLIGCSIWLLSNPHFDAVFRGKLSSNSSSSLEIPAVGENEKPIRKDERRKDLEVICHSGLNWTTFATGSYRYLNPKHVIQGAQAPISHTCFFDTKLYKPLPLFAFFALTRSPNLRTKTACGELIPEAFLARFGDNNWEKGEDFVKKLFTSKNLCGRWRGAWARERWMTCKTIWSCCEKRIETKLCKSR